MVLFWPYVRFTGMKSEFRVVLGGCVLLEVGI